MTDREPAAAPLAPPRFLLFVASSSPSAQRASRNLRRAMRDSGIDERAAEIVDVFRGPQRALEHQIFATPVLTCTADPGAPVYGDLSDDAVVRRFLQAGMETGD